MQQHKFSSVAQWCPTLCDPVNCSTPGLPVHPQLPELPQTHVHGVSDAIQPSHPLSSPILLPPSIFPSIRVFSNESVLQIRWPEYWSFNFSINPSNPHLEGTVNESTAKEQRLSLCPLRVPPAGSWGFQMVLQRASHAGSEKGKLFLNSLFTSPNQPSIFQKPHGTQTGGEMLFIRVRLPSNDLFLVVSSKGAE